uniref:SFRICE_026964 n=1 Tax=Spodoptera frugiperda TaxID=7108 RepID=A0A2H1WWA8_SPOFR
MTMMQRAADNRFDFSNIRMMPPYLCHYWLGFNADQFYDLLNSIPNLAEQVRTGDSNERLATLFNKPRTTLERWMSKA